MYECIELPTHFHHTFLVIAQLDRFAARSFARHSNIYVDEQINKSTNNNNNNPIECETTNAHFVVFFVWKMHL